MISLIVRSPNLKEEIRFPATYEELQLALWKLGLVEHDPATYTIGSLATEFRCQSEVGERIAELICEEDTLAFVAEVINHYVLAQDRIQDPMTAALLDETLESMEELDSFYHEMIDEESRFVNYFHFPLHCEFNHPKMGMKKGTNHDLREYVGQVYLALQYAQDRLFHNIPQLTCGHFRENQQEIIDKILNVNWEITSVGDIVAGQVFIESDIQFTLDELDFLCGWIERINRDVLNPRMANWSILTNEGLFYVRLWREEALNSVMWSEEDSYEFAEDGEDKCCICPECRVQRAQQDQAEKAKWLEEMSSGLLRRD